MAYAFKKSGAWQEIAGAFILGDGDDAIQYPGDWPDRVSNEERLAHGVLRIAEPDPAPDDVKLTGSTITGTDSPVRAWTILEPDLIALKATYRARAEETRDVHLNGGCDTPSGRVDTDLESRINISGSVQMAAILGAAFSAVWRRADNSYVTLNAAAMAAVGLAAGQHVAICYAACFAIKDAITAADTRAAVRDVDLDVGYPV